MKYRIKDPDERKAIELLTGITEFSLNDIKHHYWRMLNNELHYDIRGTLEVEPVKEFSYADALDTTLGTSCKPKKTNSGMQNPQLELPLWDPSKDVDRDGIINPKYKIT